MEIRVEGLRFARERRPVLDIPSLCLREGRRTAVLGPNGAGKTTLLRLIAALEQPQAGEIRLGGRPVRPDRATRHAIAFAFQQPAFLSRSVRENLDLGLELRRVEEPERRERIAGAAGLLGVEHLLDRRADRLSGGEARRVSLALALCLRAPVVLLDEPLSGLDPSSRTRLADELPTILRAFGATTLLVTHDRDEALRLGDDLVVLIEGRVRACGEKRQLLAGLRSRAVAEVLGYTLLTVEGEPIAVPPGTLRVGRGPRQCRMIVEEVIDLVERREVVGQVGERRVRAPLPPTSGTPRPGEPLLVHVEGPVVRVDTP